MLATAHAAKFETIVEPLTGARVPVPDTLARLMDRPAGMQRLALNLDALRTALLES